MKIKWFAFLFLTVALAFTLWLTQGCNKNVPTLATMAVPTVTPSTSWYFETSSAIGSGKNQWNDTGFNDYAGTPVPGTTSWSQPGYNGSVGCLNDAITFTASKQSDTVQYTPSTGLNFIQLGVNSISFEVWVDGSLNSTTVQIYFQSGSGTWEWSNQMSVTAGGWNNVTFTPTWVKSGESPTNVQSFWITLISGGAGTGNFKLDNIMLNPGTIVPTPTPPPVASPTATFTPVSAYSWYFDSSTMGAGGNDIGTAANQSGTWYDQGGQGVTGVVSWATPGYNGSTGCFQSFVTFTTTGQSDQIQYNLSSPMNWTSMGVIGIRAEVWVDNTLDNTTPVAQQFTSSGSGSVWEYGGYTSLTANAWTFTSFVPPFSTTGTDPTNVKSFWFRITTNGGTSFGSGNVKLDNIELY